MRQVRQALFFLFFLLSISSYSSSKLELEKKQTYHAFGIGLGYSSFHPPLYDKLRLEFGFPVKAPNKEYNTSFIQYTYQLPNHLRLGMMGHIYETDSRWNKSNRDLKLRAYQTYVMVGYRVLRGRYIHGGFDLGLGTGESSVNFFSSEKNGATYQRFIAIAPSAYVDIPFIILEGALSFRLSYHYLSSTGEDFAGDDLGSKSGISSYVSFGVVFLFGNFTNRSTNVEESYEGLGPDDELMNLEEEQLF